MENNVSTATNQTVRFGDNTAQIQTITLNGVVCLRLQDVQRRFPSVTNLCIDDVQLSFLSDEDGNDLKPLRIAACVDKVIEALEPVGSNNDAVVDRLDRITADMQDVRETNKLILANTQETLSRLKNIMTQMYELQEYTTPRYFFILPEKHHDLAIIDGVKKKFSSRLRLYFLCECSDEADKLHVAPHEGYLITKPTEFVIKYAPYLRKTLQVVQIMLTVGGLVLPHLASASTTITYVTGAVGNNESKDSKKFKESNTDIKNGLGQVEKVIESATNQTTRTDITGLAGGKSHETPLQGAELRKLDSFLKGADSENSLGNLYRTVTDDGHVRWVCLQHYNSIGFNNMMSDYIRQFEAFGGKFNKENNHAVVKGIHLKTKNIDMLCNALTKGFNIVSLTFEECLFNDKDLDKFFDVAINRSSVRCLVLSNTTVNVSQWLGVSKSTYICRYISVHINNKVLKVQFFNHSQNEDMKLFIRLCSQNKVCRAFHTSSGNFLEYGKEIRRYLQIKQESSTLIMNYLNNIEFLDDILNGKSPVSHLKLSCWSSSPSIISRFCEILKKNSSLVELSITDYHCYDDERFITELLDKLQGHKSITSLTLHIYHMEPSSQKELCLLAALLQCPFISRLHFSESTISKNFVQAVTFASKNDGPLNHLEFYDCRIDDDDKENLQMLYDSGDLDHLSFSNEQYWTVVLAGIRQQHQADIGQYQNTLLEQMIQEEKSHSEVNLYKTELMDRDIEIVIKEAIDNKQCIGLYLGLNKFTSIGISVLADSLKDNKTLERLSLFDNQICDNAVYFLAKILSTNNGNLKKLDLGKNKITDQGVRHLAEMLKVNKTLTLLYLTQNEITDDAVVILADTIQNYNTTIELLHLSENKRLTDSCVDSLVSMIKHNQSLKDFRICDCSLSADGKEKLKTIPKSKENWKILV